VQEYRPGDIVEVETAKGLAYVEVTHSHPSYPPVVRFLGGPVKERPKDITALTQRDHKVIAMVPLEGVLKKLNLTGTKVSHLPYAGPGQAGRDPLLVVLGRAGADLCERA
jgi:hypothetical protein